MSFQDIERELIAEIERLREAMLWIASHPHAHPGNLADVAREALVVPPLDRGSIE